MSKKLRKQNSKNPRVAADSSMAGDAFERDRRGKRHHHWAVTVVYEGGGEFQRVYADEGRAKRFAARQGKSPVVEKAKVQLIS